MRYVLLLCEALNRLDTVPFEVLLSLKFNICIVIAGPFNLVDELIVFRKNENRRNWKRSGNPENSLLLPTIPKYLVLLL